jgi:hypothetical protein
MTFVFRREQAENYADALDCLPAGKYRVMITSVETKETRSGTGRYMRLKMQVLDGQYANWSTTDMINIENDNKKAEEIGWQQLKKLVKAIWGEFPEEFTAQDLENQILVVTTKVEEYNGSLSSKVKGYVNAEAPAAPAAPAVEEDDIPEIPAPKAKPAPQAAPARVSPRPAVKSNVPF